MLKRVVIENYRSCIRTPIDLHPKLSVFIGPNGSGKTNILQGIMLLNRISAVDPYTFHSRVETASVSSRLKAVMQVHRAKVELKAFINASTDDSNSDVVRGSRQEWELKERNGQRASFELPIALVAEGRYKESSRQELLEIDRYAWRMQRQIRTVPHRAMPMWSWRALYRVGEFLRGMTYYSASQFTNPGACPASFQIEQEGGRRMLLRLRGHTRTLYKMYSAKKAPHKEKFERFFEIVGPKGLHLVDNISFREVETSSTDYSVKVGGKIERRRKNRLLVVPQFTVGKQKLSPNQLSEGTFKTLVLLFHVLTDEGTLVMVEEPEVCVHHGLLSSILELIKAASREKQIILSTHSDYVLDHIAPENVFRVTHEKNVGTLARPIHKTLTSNELAALREYLETEGNLGDYWREGGLGDEQ